MPAEREESEYNEHAQAGPSMMIAIGVSALVGIIFGFYPAQRAARMDPIVALRTE